MRAAVACVVLTLAGCSSRAAPREQATPQTHASPAVHTSLHEPPTTRARARGPSTVVVEEIWYDAPLGRNVALVTPVHPSPRAAILWIHGGLDWSLADDMWSERTRENDQTALQYAEANDVEMYASFRGCNQNPGDKEYFVGEVDDALAALRALATRPDVDPARIYLGGDSAGATLALLVAARSPAVAGVIAFGPIDRVESYGHTGTILDGAPPAELALRSPLAHLAEIHVPTWIIEGEHGDVRAWAALRSAPHDPNVHFVRVPGVDHFGTLAPLNYMLAQQIDAHGIDLSAEKVAAAMRDAFRPLGIP